MAVSDEIALASYSNSTSSTKESNGDIGGNLSDKHGTKERYAIIASVGDI